MWQAETQVDCQWADVRAFIGRLNESAATGAARLAAFDPDRPVALARAPGRLDVMGGIADYSGSLVLQLPIAEATLAAAQRDARRRVRIESPAAPDDDRQATFEIDLDELLAMTDAQARAHFNAEPARQWAGYVAGALIVLAGRGAAFDHGVRLVIRSDVPEGKGVSSSAAIEVASMSAIAAVFGVSLEPTDLAAACQRVENHIVGAPCGIMDQMTSACGRQDKLMRLLCRPAELQGHVDLPPGVSVWGIDSGVRHAVRGSDYGAVRCGAFMGRRIVNTLATEPVDHLAGVDVRRFERELIDHLPERMTGRQFLQAYGDVDDPVTQVDPDRTYAVRTPAAHPIYEHARVQRFAERLEAQLTEPALRELGELMLASHAGYTACGLGSNNTDMLVDMLTAGDPEKTGIYGAKITGGGSGGTVAVLGRPGARDTVHEIARRYAAQAGRGGYVFEGSSPGAAQFGIMTLT